MAQLATTIVPDDLTAKERSLLGIHLASAFLTGISMGVLFLADTIVAKTLGGSNFSVTLINLLMGAGFLSTLFTSGMMRNRRKGPFLIGAALVGRVALGLTGLWVHTAWYITMVGLAWFGQALIVTGQVSIIQKAYGVERRDQLFGLSLSVNMLARLLATVGAGWVMDWNESTYRIVYAVAGLAGLVGAVLLDRMERRSLEGTSPGSESIYRPLGEAGWAAGWRGARESAQHLWRILREDTAFRRFERNFFIYGIAFLALMPIVPIFLVHDLELDYARIGLARGLMAQSGMILFGPLSGRVMRRSGPMRFSSRVFALLSLYPFLLLLSAYFPGSFQISLVYAGFLAFGIAMAGVNVAWNLSSIHFAGDADPSSYQAVHSVLVGARGVVAPLLGYAIVQTASTRAGFALTAGLFLTAAFLMARMAREPAAGQARAALPTVPAGAQDAREEAGVPADPRQ